MEKAVLKTLVYADIFDYPLKAWEIHKWLIGKSLTLRQLEKVLGKLEKKSLIKKQQDFYFLTSRARLVTKRLDRQKYSENLIRQSKVVTLVLKFIPGIKLIGISGALAMNNAQSDDDIDLFVITAKNRLWLVRFLMLAIFTLIMKRRRPKDNRLAAAGKFCLNTILEDDQLTQQKHDLYTAHEVLQMRVLWQRDDTYTNFLFANQWVFKYLPNWIGSEPFKKPAFKKNTHPGRRPWARYTCKVRWLDFLNYLAEKIQKDLMHPVGQERVDKGSVYFHPKDYRVEILTKYKDQSKTLTG